jgi:plasmid stabilization system protein ParE
MDVTYHPLVRGDVEEALSYYHKVCARLADEFHAELPDLIHRAAVHPLRFHQVDQGFRRASLRRFPYHVLYEVHLDCVRVMLVRHNKRHPRYGLSRN